MSELEDNLLPSTQAYILNERAFAGRYATEDKSLLPKAVYCPTDHDPGDLKLWDVIRLRDGHYTLSARGAPTGEVDGLLYAFLVETEHEKAEEWVVTKRKEDGHLSLYTIEKADKKAGWVRQTGEDDPQIAIRPLIVTGSEPPHFHASGLWNIQPLFK